MSYPLKDQVAGALAVLFNPVVDSARLDEATNFLVHFQKHVRPEARFDGSLTRYAVRQLFNAIL